MHHMIPNIGHVLLATILHAPFTLELIFGSSGDSSSSEWDIFKGTWML